MKLLRETKPCHSCGRDVWHSVRLLSGPPGSARLYRCLGCGTKTEAVRVEVAKVKHRRDRFERKSRFRVGA